MLNRRQFTLAAAAALSATGVAAQAIRRGPPIIIGHRGASGERPEHTRAAYDLAIEQGADFIEPDLVVTKDGALVARHENEISATTDVAARPQFAARRATKTVDGAEVSGWFTEDFTLAELKTLLCKERLPGLRPQSARFDGKEPILTFQEVIEIARQGSIRTGRVIGVYPEMKHPAYFAGIDLPMESRLAVAARTAGYFTPAAAMIIQCFEPEPLKAIARQTNLRRVQLISADPRYQRMISAEGLREVAGYAQGVGVQQDLLLRLQGDLTPTPLIAEAHAAGLAVHGWTVRPENEFLPPMLRKGSPRARDFARRRGDVKALFLALYAAGVDGLFTDFPALAVSARTEAARLAARRR